jgi:hypothetical protein
MFHPKFECSCKMSKNGHYSLNLGSNSLHDLMKKKTTWNHEARKILNWG